MPPYKVAFCIICLTLTVTSHPNQEGSSSNVKNVVRSLQIFPRLEQNCSDSNHVYIEETGECLKQVPIDGPCLYNKQCSYLIPNSICTAWKSDTEDDKTCQCPPQYIRSVYSNSCIRKRPCTSSSPAKPGQFNPVDGERGNCSENMKCLDKEHYCICKNGFGMDDRGKCVIWNGGYDDANAGSAAGEYKSKTSPPLQPPITPNKKVLDKIEANANKRKLELEEKKLNESSKADMKKEDGGKMKHWYFIGGAILFASVLVAFLMCLALKWGSTQISSGNDNQKKGKCNCEEMKKMLPS